MDAHVISWPAWNARTRAANGQGVCCCEAQADGVPCARPTGECERCARAYARFAIALGVAGELPMEMVLDAS